MANFSVEWLSRSHYEEKTLNPKVHRELGGFAEAPGRQCSPTSPNNSCGHASGSESEVGDDSEGEAVQQRRMRTKFTTEQIRKLESSFSKHRYLSASQRRKIAEKLNLSETQVKTWFQNRRMKLKREVHDLRPEFLSVLAALLPPLLFQHPVPSGQLPASSSGFLPQPQQRMTPPPALHQRRSHPAVTLSSSPELCPPADCFKNARLESRCFPLLSLKERFEYNV